MIYPSAYPGAPHELEGKVLKALKTVVDKYDIFYSHKFTAFFKKEQANYEADFIAALSGKVEIGLRNLTFRKKLK